MFEKLKKTFFELSDSQRMGLAGGVVLIVIVTASLAWWLLRTEYEVLFADLEPQDAAAVVKELQAEKIPYKLGKNGNDILVDRDNVHDSRLKLMGKGVLLSGTVGFEIFDQSDIGMTEYSQKINYQRALQGELSRTIMSVAAVKYARVHLVLPNSSIFKQKGSQPKASVSLVTKPGKQLRKNQIEGIQRLVAAAVPGLEPGTVTIMDQNGVAISKNGTEKSNIATVGDQLSLKRQVEQEVVRKVVDVLDRTYGPGKAIVGADVTLDMDQVRRTTEKVVPVNVDNGKSEGVIVRKRYSVQNKSALVQTAAVGSNVAAASSQPRNTTSEVEYEIGKSVEQVISTPGSIKRLSISVLVPGDMGQEAIAKLENVVSMAVGLNVARGDGIAVYPVAQLTQAGTVLAQPDTDQIPVGSDIKPAQDRMAPEVESQGVYKYVAITRHWVSTNLTQFVVAIAISMIILIVLAIWMSVRVRAARAIGRSRKLSEEDRQRLLLEIKSWLQSGELKGQGQL